MIFAQGALTSPESEWAVKDSLWQLPNCTAAPEAARISCA